MKNLSISSQTVFKFFGQDRSLSITVPTYLKIFLSNSKKVNSTIFKLSVRVDLRTYRYFQSTLYTIYLSTVLLIYSFKKPFSDALLLKNQKKLVTVSV